MVGVSPMTLIRDFSTHMQRSELNTKSESDHPVHRYSVLSRGRRRGKLLTRNSKFPL